MKLTEFSTKSFWMTSNIRTTIFCLASVALAACGGGGPASTGGNGTNGFVPSQAVTIRPLPPEYAARKAVNYGSWRTSDRGAEIAALNNPATQVAKIASMKADILEDMRILQAGNIRMIRLFNAIDDGKIILQVLDEYKAELDIKVHLGTWIEGDLYVNNPTTKVQIEADNLKGIEELVALATDDRYKRIILAVSVGNESLASWSGHRAVTTKVAAYIKNVRDRVTQPVTTDDYWGFYAGHADSPDPGPVLNAIDFASIHIYPLADSVSTPSLWDWAQLGTPLASRASAMMAAALASAKQDYQYVRTYLDLKGHTAMPIVIGETGWKASPTGGEKYRAAQINQQMHYSDLNAWRDASRASGTGPLNFIWFEAFDEPWKGGDNGWGLFTVERKARYAVRNLYPVAQWAPFTETEATKFIAPVINTAIPVDRYSVWKDGITDTTYGALNWDPFVKSIGSIDSSDAPPSLGTKSFKIVPNPEVWGWGMLLYSRNDADIANLSNFTASGKLNFWIKTTYPGKIEVGIRTLIPNPGALDTQAFLALSNGDQYGYRNDGSWRLVSIPLSALLAGSTANVTYVIDRFIIADRFEKTGKDQRTTDLPTVSIAEIYYSK